MHDWSHHKPSVRTPRLPPRGSSPPPCRRSALPTSLCLPSFVSLPTPLLATHPLRPHLPPMAWQHPRCQPVGFGGGGGGGGSWRRPWGWRGPRVALGAMPCTIIQVKELLNKNELNYPSIVLHSETNNDAISIVAWTQFPAFRKSKVSLCNCAWPASDCALLDV
jgi:hypothetical protein